MVCRGCAEDGVLCSKRAFLWYSSSEFQDICPLCDQDCDEKRANRCTAQCRHRPAIRRLKKLCKLAEINEEIRTTTYKGHERIDEIAEKWELIGTHTGRRTFIIHALSRGIPPSIAMRWTGDSDYKSMKPYIDIVDEIKAKEMNKMNFMD